ncbi:trichothecene 3-O-acetyltransferase [Botrytis cinerea]
MNSAAPGKRQDVCLDILGQQPSNRMYTQVCLCFPVADDSSYSAIIVKLTSGLDRLSTSFPWIAGKVINEGSCKDNTGVYKIHTLEQTDLLVLKDLRDESSIPTMDTLRRSNFPFGMLDENIFAPCKGHPGDQSASDPAPVFILQANLINGGIILTFVSQHQTMDMVGQGQIMYLLSKACHNKPFTEEEVLSEAITGPDHISTDDALSAFIWQSVIRARLPRLGPTIKSTFGRSVDVRSRMNIPVTYPGLMSNTTYTTYTAQELVAEPLGVVASRLRSDLNPATSSLIYDTRALATSWAKIGIYDLDFNLGLGKPEAVRRPRFNTVQSLMFLMPKTLDGEIAAAICLRDDDLNRLQEDNEFRKYGVYIG